MRADSSRPIQPAYPPAAPRLTRAVPPVGAIVLPPWLVFLRRSIIVACRCASQKFKLESVSTIASDEKALRTDAENIGRELTVSRDSLVKEISDLKSQQTDDRYRMQHLQQVSRQDESENARLMQEGESLLNRVSSTEMELSNLKRLHHTLEKQLDEERSAWTKKVDKESRNRREAESRAKDIVEKLVVVEAKLAHSNELLGQMENDKVQFMADLDKTMGTLTDSVQKREHDRVADFEQRSKADANRIEQQWRQKYEDEKKASAGQIEVLKLDIETLRTDSRHAADMALRDNEALKIRHGHEQALATAALTGELETVWASKVAEAKDEHGKLQIEHQKLAHQMETSINVLTTEGEALRREVAELQGHKTKLEHDLGGAQQTLRSERKRNEEHAVQLQHAFDAANQAATDDKNSALESQSFAERREASAVAACTELQANFDLLHRENAELSRRLEMQEDAARRAEIDWQAKLETIRSECAEAKSDLRTAQDTHTHSLRRARDTFRQQAAMIARHVGLLREDCSVLQTEATHKLEMLKNDTMRDVGELQWHHKEDIGKIADSMSGKNYSLKKLYEDNMERFRQQIESEYDQTSERMHHLHQMELQQLRTELSTEKESELNTIRPVLEEERAKHTSAVHQLS